MAVSKTKIVLDADVIIHFTKGGLLDLLPKIFPEFQYIVLDVVKRELPVLIVSALNNQIIRGKNIKEEQFGGTSGEIKEYARITATNGPALGKGESACMVYCRYHHDVVGSSNTKDITAYCDQFGITYLTTNDFLFYAIQRKLITKLEADNFIQKVKELGSNPTVVDFETYVCRKV